MKRRRDKAAAKGRRIVSLLPSATEIVCALGLEDRLVGISHSCDYPESIVDRPRLSSPRARLNGLSSGEIDAAVRAALHDDGSVYEIVVEGLVALEPDLILTNGNVLTQDDALQRAEAFAVKDGKFLAVGSNAEVRNLASSRTRVIDAARMTGTMPPSRSRARAWDLVRVVDMSSARRLPAVVYRTPSRAKPCTCGGRGVGTPFGH